MFGFIGKAVHSATHALASATHAVGGALSHVPIVGGGLHGVFELTIGAPFEVADAVASGKRIDRVAFDHLKRTVADVKEIAPYVQTVISFVPGVGPGISGAIAGGLALASGAKITDAVMAAAKGALPGGALAQSAFDVGRSVVQGSHSDMAKCCRR